MERLDDIQVPVTVTRTERHGFVVLDDLAGMPVTDDEIAVVEAFLMAEVRRLLAGDSGDDRPNPGHPDSDVPQIDAEVIRPLGRESATRGIGR